MVRPQLSIPARDAAAAITSAGGLVFLDWHWRDGHQIEGGAPSSTRWLVDLIGADYFGHVTRVTFFAGASDSALVQIARLTRLQQLEVPASSFSDAGLAQLKGLSDLSELDLRETQFPDASLAHLERLTKLSKLDLNATRVTDAGLDHLKGLTKLSDLDLRLAG